MNGFEAIFASFAARIFAFLQLPSRAIRVFAARMRVEIQKSKTRASLQTCARMNEPTQAKARSITRAPAIDDEQQIIHVGHAIATVRRDIRDAINRVARPPLVDHGKQVIDVDLPIAIRERHQVSRAACGVRAAHAEVVPLHIAAERVSRAHFFAAFGPFAERKEVGFEAGFGLDAAAHAPHVGLNDAILIPTGVATKWIDRAHDIAAR